MLLQSSELSIYGHATGDQVLQKVAELIKSQLHRKTDVVGRFGGEEFLVILPYQSNTTSQEMRQGTLYVADKIRASVETESRVLMTGINTHHVIKNPIRDITISVGVCLSSESRSTYNDVLIAADKAVYRAKNAGRNKVAVFDDAVEARGLKTTHR